MATPSGQTSGRRRPRSSDLNPPEMQQRRPIRSTATGPSMPPGAGPSMPPGAFVTTICQRISKKKRDSTKHKYINDDDWTRLLENWATEPALKRSKLVAESRTSDLDGKGMHKHCAGPQNFLKIEYDMMNDNGSPNSVNQTASAASTPTHILLNQEYLKCGQSKRGPIYGIGSVQYWDFNPSETVPASIQHNLDMDMRISGLEKNSEAVNANVEMVKADMLTLKDDMVALKSEFKDEMAATRASLNVILQALGVNSATLNQVNRTQPSVPAATTINPLR